MGLLPPGLHLTKPMIIINNKSNGLKYMLYLIPNEFRFSISRCVVTIVRGFLLMILNFAGRVDKSIFVQIHRNNIRPGKRGFFRFGLALLGKAAGIAPLAFLIFFPVVQLFN